MSVTLNTVVYDSFFALPHAYRRLFESNTSLTYDQTEPWFAAFEKHLLGAGRLILIGVEKEADCTPVALLPLQLTYQWKRPFRVRVLKGLSNYYTANFEPVIDATADVGRIAAALAKCIHEQSRSWYVFDLNPHKSSSPVMPYLSSELRALSYRVESYFRFWNWSLPVERHGYDELFATFPSRLQSTIKRKVKKWEQINGAELKIIAHTDQISDALRDYEIVYARSWKKQEAYPQFILDVVTEYARRGWLRMGLAYIDGEPVAAQIWFVVNRCASIFKLAYSETYKDLSIGSIVTHALMRHVIDGELVATVDFLSGDDLYKRDWMHHRSMVVGLRVYHRHSLLAWLYAGKTMLRRVVQQPAAKQ